MSVTKSESYNIISPEGNSLAVFVDVNSGILTLKDVKGVTEPIANYINDAALRYVLLFTDSDWIISGNDAYIEILQTQHLKGLFPVVTVRQILDFVANDVGCQIAVDTATGDIRVLINKNGIFSGQIIII